MGGGGRMLAMFCSFISVSTTKYPDQNKPKTECGLLTPALHLAFCSVGTSFDPLKTEGIFFVVVQPFIFSMHVMVFIKRGWTLLNEGVSFDCFSF